MKIFENGLQLLALNLLCGRNQYRFSQKMIDPMPAIDAHPLRHQVDEVREYLRCYGHQRLRFGSDVPFGDPYSELRKVRSLHLDPDVEAAVLGGNFLRLQARANQRYLIYK